MSRPLLWCFAAIGTIAGLVTWMVRDIAPHNDPFRDSYFYWRMAEGQKGWAPFGYRILAPAFVRALPTGTDVGFVLLTALSVALLASVTHVWLSRHVGPTRALAGVAIVCANVAVLGQLQVPYGSDATMLALVAVGALLADREQWLGFAIAAVAAVLTREAAVVLALVPLAAFARERDRRALVAGVATVLAYLTVQNWISVHPAPLQRPSEVLAFVTQLHGSILGAALLAVGTSFGAAWFLLPAGWSRMSSVSRSWVLVAGATVPMLFIATGWGRLLAPAFVVVAMAAVLSPVRTWGLYCVAGLTALAALCDNVPVAVSALAVGIGVVVAARGLGRHANASYRT